MSGSVDHGRRTHENRRVNKVLGTVSGRGVCDAVVVEFLLDCFEGLSVEDDGTGDDWCLFLIVFVLAVH